MELIEILSNLIRINSVNPEWDGLGEREIATWIREFFEAEGIDVREHEVLPNRPNIIAKIEGEDPSWTLIFEAHMDTVSVAEMEIAPFDPVISEGRIFGRGSVDVKAGLAAMMHAFAAIERSGKKPPITVLLAAVIDEEHAYRGVLGLLETLSDAEKPVGAIVAEPTQCHVVRANKGVLRWKIATHGKPAHTAKPELGSNAIEAMARVISAIENDNARLSEIRHPLVGSPTCCVSLIEGGSQINIVPESCEISLDRRLLPGEKAATVLADYQHLLEQLSPSISFEMMEPMLVDEAMETPENEAVVEVSSRVLDELGGEPEPVGVPFGCDATKLSRAGIPSIIFGPGSIDQAHTANEFVEIKQVELAAKFYESVIQNWPES